MHQYNNSSGREPTRRPPAALTIAGSDSCGGAGIQADIKTLTCWGVEAASVLTAITAQNTLGVGRAIALEADLVAAQLDHVLADVAVSAVKTGMLANAAIIGCVARGLAGREDMALVVDPVLVATSGARLLEPEAERVLIEKLLPLATLVTPNLPEAAALTGLDTAAPQQQLGEALLAMGCRAALIKGGHGRDRSVTDLLVTPTGTLAFRHARLEGQVHGTGCSLSAAIAAGLSLGLDLERAVGEAIDWLHYLLANAYRPVKGPLLMLPFASGGRRDDA